LDFKHKKDLDSALFGNPSDHEAKEKVSALD
jgi:hypothetical protein